MENSPSHNKQLRAQAEWLSAFGEPTRLTLIHALATGQKIVTELAKIVGTEVVNVSYHLKILKAAGVVSVKRDGRFMRHSLIGATATATATEMVLTHESGSRVVIALN